MPAPLALARLGILKQWIGMGGTAALNYVRPGDTLVVWKLDRLGRSLSHLIETVRRQRERGVEFISLTERIDTTTSGGKLVFHIFGAIAEFERDLIRERTNAGLAAARARGRFGGGQRKLSPKQVPLLQAAYDATDANRRPIHTISELCEMFRISRATLFRYVKSNDSRRDLQAERGDGRASQGVDLDLE